MPPMKQPDPKRLIDQIITRSKDMPSYALFLGSGASATSDVKTAEQMVWEWRRKLYAEAKAEAKTDLPFPAWLSEQPWYEEGEYGMLFERLHPLPEMRRRVVESLVEDAEPSWGYAYLANLLEHNYFNVVFTTNFDDLLTEACYRYTDSTRPLVAAHDSAMRNVRIKSARPKIIKLHGDFLYESIKNTPEETKALESNTLEKVKQFSREYGLIVIGYSGRDVSIMNALQEALQEENSFLPGIFWCVYKSDLRISPALQRIAEDERVFIVPIDGFDGLMAEINDATGKGLPVGLSSPYNFTRARVSILSDRNAPGLSHPIIARDAATVREEFRRLPDEITNILPLQVLALQAEQNGDRQSALRWWKQEYDSGKGKVFAAYHIARILVDSDSIEELRNFVAMATEDTNATYFLLLSGKDNAVIDLADIELSKHPQREIPRINKAIALKRLGHKHEMENEIAMLSRQIEEGNVDRPSALQSGIAALRGAHEEMIYSLKESLDAHEITVDQAREFPVFEDYRDEADFQSLLSSYEA